MASRDSSKDDSERVTQASMSGVEARNAPRKWISGRVKRPAEEAPQLDNRHQQGRKSQKTEDGGSYSSQNGRWGAS